MDKSLFQVLITSPLLCSFNQSILHGYFVCVLYVNKPLLCPFKVLDELLGFNMLCCSAVQLLFSNCFETIWKPLPPTVCCGQLSLETDFTRWKATGSRKINRFHPVIRFWEIWVKGGCYSSSLSQWAYRCTQHIPASSFTGTYRPISWAVPWVLTLLWYRVSETTTPQWC